MRKVVTPFSRRHDLKDQRQNPHPRHRREGYFDEQDEWHDSTETTESAGQHAGN
jgi:hypothetical protein